MNVKMLSIPYKLNEKVNHISPNRPNSELSLIIITKSASEALNNCLNSLFRNSDFNNEVIIICDNPSWQTVKLLQDIKLQYWNVHFEHCFMATNFGVELATRKYITSIADDMIVGPGWDSAILNIAGDGILGSLAFIDGIAMLNDNYQIGNSGIFGKNIAPEVGYNQQTRYIDDQKFDSWCRKASRDLIEGFYWPPYIHHRQDFLQDKFCFHSPHYLGHDIDFENRYKRDGWKVKTTYKSFIYHMGHAGNRDNLPILYTMGQFNNGLRICKSCGTFADGVEGNHPEYIITHQAGYWLCESCRQNIVWTPIPHKRF